MIDSWHDIPGWFDFQDVYDLAVSEASDGDTLVEVGTFLGKSIAYLDEKTKQSGKELNLVAIDSWNWEEGPRWWTLIDNPPPSPWPVADLIGMDLFEAFLRCMKESNCSAQVRRGYSAEVARSFADNSLQFVFIDANHFHEGISSDIAAWRNKVKSGGILAGHDYRVKDWPAVAQVVDEQFGNLVEQRHNSWLVRM